MDSPAGVVHSMTMDPADMRDIQSTLAGRGEAYERLIRRYQQDIARRMWRFTRDRLQLEELVHDVFVEAYMSLKGFRGEAPFSHWLNRIATRVGYRFWKSRGRPTARSMPLQDWDRVVSQDRTLAAAEAADLVHSLLARLSPRDRLVLTLLYLEELSVAEVADRTGWSQSMVKVQAHRARKKLHRLLAKADKGK